MRLQLGDGSCAELPSAIDCTCSTIVVVVVAAAGLGDLLPLLDTNVMFV